MAPAGGIRAPLGTWSSFSPVLALNTKVTIIKNLRNEKKQYMQNLLVSGFRVACCPDTISLTCD